ncbi:hypothetical protein GGX14DRAFT_545746 [Mycena pura]|uniref:Uncharacterized protein n=1 Tax=Mycena pura TaxID=153505 RepID=A0AAD6UZT5_9AGAR|nr:hypothetical protein GGX14DRAFT_545746 [Mycena pura]
MWSLMLWMGLLLPCLAQYSNGYYAPRAPEDYSACAVNPSNGPIHRDVDLAGQNMLDMDTDSTGTYYLAIYDTGAVGYEASSSNGQTYVPSAGQANHNYITTVWILDCDGVLTPILDNGTRYIFEYDTPTNTILAVTSDYYSTLSKRSFGDTILQWLGNQAGGSNPHQGDTDEPRCPVDQPDSLVFFDAPPNTPNGCGSANGFHPPQLTADFTSCCNQHDICYGDCTSSWLTCNSQFLACMLATCGATYSGGTTLDTLQGGWCRDVANSYYDLVSSTSGRNTFDAAEQDRCVCCAPDDIFCQCLTEPPPSDQDCGPEICCEVPTPESCKCCFTGC